MRLAEVSKAAVVIVAAAAAVVVMRMAAAAVANVGISAAAVMIVSMGAAAVVNVSIAAAAVVGVGTPAAAAVGVGTPAAAADMMILQLTGNLRVHANMYLCHSACSADVHEACAQCQKLCVRYKPHSNTSHGLYCTTTTKGIMHWLAHAACSRATCCSYCSAQCYKCQDVHAE